VLLGQQQLRVLKADRGADIVPNCTTVINAHKHEWNEQYN
jgi:hypothetical protein